MKKVYLEDLQKKDQNKKWMNAIKSNPHCIGSVKYPTYEMCIAAVKRSAGEISNIPKDLLDYKICDIAVNLYGPTIEHVPKRLRSKEMIIRAVKGSARCLAFLDDDEIDLEIFEIAHNQDSASIGRVKNPSEDMQLMAIKDYPSCLRHLKNPTNEVILEALARNGSLLYFVPVEKKTLDMCLVAINNEHSAFQYVDIFKDLSGQTIKFTSYNETLNYINDTIKRNDLKNKILKL